MVEIERALYGHTYTFSPGIPAFLNEEDKERFEYEDLVSSAKKEAILALKSEITSLKTELK